MKVIFMGTPDFAVETLDALVKAGHEIVLVVTQPDKPRGRSGQLAPSDVKAYALEHDLPVFQPTRIRAEEAVEELKKYPADVSVVAAFGQILPKEVLEMPRLGCVNVHASLLPKYRGAAPIQWSVLNGDPVTGVTTMQMGVGLDDGDILLQEEVVLDPWETGGSLFDKLAQVGGQLAVKTIEALDAGQITAVPQVEEESTHVGMIHKDLGRINFMNPAVEIERQIRGLNPWPSAYSVYNGKTLKIWKAGVLPDDTPEAADPRDPEMIFDTTGSSELMPGTIFAVTKDAILVKCSQGLLRLDEIQIAGKKRMETSVFLMGHKMAAGEVLGA